MNQRIRPNRRPFLHRPHRRWRRAARCAQFLTLTLLLLYAALHLAVRLAPAPPPPSPLMPSTFVYDRDGLPLAAFASHDPRGRSWHIPLDYDEISPHLFQALIAVEDRRFFAHDGVDFTAAGSAAWSNLTSLRIVRGASTLTMQVARLRNFNADPNSLQVDRSYTGKVTQAFRALQLEQQLSKKEILVEYVNRAPFGGNLIGAGAASWRYFGKSCRDLSLGQAALLAGLPQSPNRFRPDRFPARASIRRDYVLDRMVAASFITRQQADEARREPLDARWRPTPQAADPAYHNPALPTLVHIAGTHEELRTTFSTRVMHEATTLTRSHLATLRASGVTAAAVVVLDTPTAECLAALSLCDETPHIDLTRAPRSSGSTLKSFIYAAAMDAGLLRPDTVLDDSPAVWAGYAPANFDRAFRGPISAADALADSRNIPAMAVLARLGIDRAVATLDGFGLTTLVNARRTYGLPLAVGGADVTALELAQAYATLARGGIPKTVRFTPSLSPQSSSLSPLLSPAACDQTLACLTNPDRTRAIAAEAAALKPAWKTGTSSGRRDAWCAAVTPRLTVVVWLGHPNAKGSQALVGVESAAPLALRLIAALDPGGPTWELSHTPTPTPALMDRRPTHPPLSIVTPAPNQHIVLHDDQRADQQKIALTSAGGQGTQRFWFVDNQSLPTSNYPTTWWTPTKGTHTLKVLDPEGGAASVRITVH